MQCWIKISCFCWQGLLQCCVTGPAFEQVLLQADSAVVQVIMSSLVVCARMKGQQKGQVVDLLSQQGLHRTVQGEQCHLKLSMNWLPDLCQWYLPVLCACVYMTRII